MIGMDTVNHNHSKPVIIIHLYFQHKNDLSLHNLKRLETNLNKSVGIHHLMRALVKPNILNIIIELH